MGKYGFETNKILTIFSSRRRKTTLTLRGSVRAQRRLKSR